jgi:putative salt-induced outer membrane protein YdiY
MGSTNATLPRCAVATVLALTLSSLAARAQDSTKTAAAHTGDSTKTAAPATPPPKPKPPPFAAFHLDLGYVNTSGNTVVSTLNLADNVVLHTSPDNQVDQMFSVVYGTSQNKVQTSLWTADLRDEYKFTSHVGLYALGEFDRNTFAGIDRRLEEGIGAAITAIDTHRNHLEFSFGSSYIEQQAVSDSTNHSAALHTSVLYKYSFKKEAYVQEFLEGIPDLQNHEDYRVNSQTDVVAPLSKHLALKLGYAVRYANLPPPGFKTTDRLLTSDLQVTF